MLIMTISQEQFIESNFNDFYPELEISKVICVQKRPINIKMGPYYGRTAIALYEIQYQNIAGVINHKFIIVKKKGNLSKFEYPRMKNVWDSTKLNGMDYLLPRPLYATKTELFTEYLPGSSLLHFFVRRLLRGLSYLFLRQLENKVIQVARWLINYQSLSKFFEWESLSSYIDNAQSMIEQSIRFPKEFQQRVLSIITSPYWLKKEIPKIDSHGDFYFRNMIFKRSNIYLTDWESRPFRGNLFLDVHSFYFNLQSFSRLPLYSISTTKYLSRIFLQEYFMGTSLPIERNLYRFTKILFQIQYLDDYDNDLNKWTPARSKLNDRYMMRLEISLKRSIEDNLSI